MKRSVMFVTVAALASCGNNGPTEDEYNDVAQAIGSTTTTGGGGGEIGSMADSAKLAIGTLPAGLTAEAGGHISGQHFGLDYDYTVTCKGENGATMAVCDETTDSAELTVDWSGALDLTNFSASVERTGDWTLSDIQSGTPTFTGEGTFTLDISVTSIFRPVTSTYHLDYDAQYDHVQLDANDRAVGGAIHYTVAAEHTVTGAHGSGEGSFDIQADVVFNANGTASITLDGSHKYHLDLASGVVSKG